MRSAWTDSRMRGWQNTKSMDRSRYGNIKLAFWSFLICCHDTFKFLSYPAKRIKFRLQYFMSKVINQNTKNEIYFQCQQYILKWIVVEHPWNLNRLPWCDFQLKMPGNTIWAIFRIWVGHKYDICDTVLAYFCWKIDKCFICIPFHFFNIKPQNYVDNFVIAWQTFSFSLTLEFLVTAFKNMIKLTPAIDRILLY